MGVPVLRELPTEVVAGVLVSLEQMGIARKSAGGEWTLAKKDIFAPWGSAFNALHLRNWMERGFVRTLTKTGNANHSLNVFAVSAENYPKIRELCLKFTQEFEALTRADQKPEEAACFYWNPFKV